MKKVKKEEERRKKEDEKLVSMRASKDTKIKVVDAGIITKLKNNSQSSHPTSTKIKGIGVYYRPFSVSFGKNPYTI